MFVVVIDFDIRTNVDNGSNYAIFGYNCIGQTFILWGSVMEL